MITRIKLKNLRSHDESEFKFSEGTNALVGILGSGKSLPYHEKVLIKQKVWYKEEIGKIVEKTLEKSEKICVRGGTVISTENPYSVFVKSFNPNTFRLEVKPVTAFIRHKSPSTLIQIRTKTGRRITVTEDHSLLVFKNGEFVPCRGSGIKKGDFIPSVRRLSLEPRIDKIRTWRILPDFRDTTKILRGLQLIDGGETFARATEIIGIDEPYTLENWKRREEIPPPGMIIDKVIKTAIQKEMKVSREFARLSGAYVAEGNCEYDEGESRYGVRVTNKNPEFMGVVKSCAEKAFPYINSSVFSKSFEMHGKVTAAFFKRLFGSSSGEKRIPYLVYGFEDEKLADFLMMYFEGDGWVVPDNELACSSKSLTLIDGLITLLSRWGILTKIREREVEGEKYYTLNIFQKNIPEFAKHTKFLSKDKRKKLERFCKIIENRKRWDGIDIVPEIGDLLHSLILEYHLSSKKRPKMRSMSNNFRSVYLGYQNIGRERLKRCLRSIFRTFKHKTKNFKILEKVVNGDIFFDEVVEVVEVPARSDYVYDLSVEGFENFVAGIGNVIVHNSTVMNALSFGLFGTFPDLQARKVKLDEIIMNKPSVKDTAEVEVDFKTNGKTYTVIRTIERGKGTTYSEIREGDKLLDAPNSQRVTELVEKILKVNYELFSKAIYSEQNALDYFLTLPRGERMRRIDNLLMIDKFEKARSSTVTVRNKLVERKLGKQSIIEQTDLEELKKNLQDLEYGLKGLKKTKENLTSDVKELTEKKNEIEKRLKELEKLNEDLISLKQEKKSLETGIAENEKTIEKIKELLKGRKPDEIKDELSDLSERLEKLESELEKKREEHERLTKLISESQTKIEFLEKDKIRNLKEEMSKKLEAQEKLKEIKEEFGKEPIKTFKEEKKTFDEIERNLASVKTKLSETQELLKRMLELEDKCPVCLSDITEEKRQDLIEQRRKKIKDLEEKLKDLKGRKEVKRRTIEELEEITEKFESFLNEVKDLDELQTELKNLKEKHSDLRMIIETQKEKFNEIKEEIKDFKERLEKNKDEKQNLEFIVSRLTEFEKIKQRLSDFKSKEEAVKEKISSVMEKIGEQDVREIRKEFTEISSKKSELVERLKNIGSIIEEKENRKKEYEEKLDLIKTQKKRVARLEKIIKDLKIFEKALEKTQVQLRNEFIDAVNYTMNEIWPNLYPYEDFTGITLHIEEGDYVLQLKTRAGDWVSADGIASGGERSIACLALRIAFALTLAPHIRMLVLDEPTMNLDSAAIKELATTLRERINEFINQTFLISHQAELEDAVTGSAYRLERDKVKDGVTNVIPLT